MINTLIDNNIFLIVFSGILIFVMQRLVIDLWILPNIEFQKCLVKIDALLIRYEFLCDYEYGSNSGANDEDVIYFRTELRNIVIDIVAKYRTLFFAERWWYKFVLRMNINQTKPQSLLLSRVISDRNDVMKVDSVSKKLINDIRYNLKLEEFKIDYSML